MSGRTDREHPYRAPAMPAKCAARWRHHDGQWAGCCLDADHDGGCWDERGIAAQSTYRASPNLVADLSHARATAAGLQAGRDEAKARVERMEAVLRDLLAGTRDYAARGLGETWAVEYEMPPSTAKKVRRMLTEALAAREAGKEEG